MLTPLVPELDITDLDASLDFYISVCGFELVFDRPEERFAYLNLDGAELMLEEASGPGRRFRTAPLEYPFGRGMNLQIIVANVDVIYERVMATGTAIVIPLEERWYRAPEVERGNRQFVAADPDGYLLRFFQDLGERPIKARC